MQPPHPINEEARLEALHAYDVLDTAPEEAFDDLTRLASYICGTPVAMVSLVDGNRQWFKSRVGADMTETPRDVAFCAHAIMQPDLFVVPDAEADQRFRDNPLVHGDPHIRFYAGAPLITPDGHAIGTLCAVDHVPRQLTQQQREALKALARQAMDQLQLRRSLKQLRELEQLRDDLTHMIVHDLRTPLTSILAGLQTVQSAGEMNLTQAECLDLAVQGGRTLLGMINDLLDISKMESGSLSLEASDLKVGAMIDGALQQVAPLAAEKQIPLIKQLEPDLPPLYADEEKLTRTLVNLLGNAIKFTPNGGAITLVARQSETQKAIQFSVSDTGEGIPPEDQERIFDRFAQVQNRKGGRRMSTGLGLTFCKLAVEAHGGRIWVESEVGKGSVFVFIMPLS